eukprot:tig00000492_g1386.t1
MTNAAAGPSRKRPRPRAAAEYPAELGDRMSAAELRREAREARLREPEMAGREPGNQWNRLNAALAQGRGTLAAMYAMDEEDFMRALRRQEREYTQLARREFRNSVARRIVSLALPGRRRAAIEYYITEEKREAARKARKKRIKSARRWHAENPGRRAPPRPTLRPLFKRQRQAGYYIDPDTFIDYIELDD